MERLVNPALSFCMVIRRREHCFLYQLAMVDFKSSSYQICCQHIAHQRWVMSEGILASVFLSFSKVPTTVPHFVSIAPFNPFCGFADEEIRTRGVSPPEAGVGGVDSNLPDPWSLTSATGQSEPLRQMSGRRSPCVFHVELEPFFTSCWYVHQHRGHWPWAPSALLSPPCVISARPLKGTVLFQAGWVQSRVFCL